jgi:UDP-2,3-diacylglucosamine hydrolase
MGFKHNSSSSQPCETASLGISQLRTQVIELADHVQEIRVVSDVHLRQPGDFQEVEFLKFLRNTKALGATCAIILLGDIFDFIYFPSAHHRKVWINVFCEFDLLRAAGVTLIFLEGNHDFGFEHGRKSELNRYFDFAGDAEIILKGASFGELILGHGDNIVCPPSYHFFRGLVKNKWFQFVTGFIPGVFTYELFTRYAKLSRTKDKYRTLDPIFFRSCVEKWIAQKPKPKAVILGHVHVWFEDKILETSVFVGPDWFAAPSYLRVLGVGKGVGNGEGIGPHLAQVERVWLTAKTVLKFDHKEA